MQKITPFLWFDDKAEEAAKFYVSVFKNSELGAVSRYGESAAKASGRPAGSAMTVEFQLDGQKFVALNGGPDDGAVEDQSRQVTLNCEVVADPRADHVGDVWFGGDGFAA